MAYIPDEAVERSGEISPAAFRLYCLICRRRDHKRGHALLTPERATEILHLSQSQYFRAAADLQRQQWIVKQGGIFIPVLGDFSRLDARWKDSQKRESTDSQNREPYSRNRELDSQKCESHIRKSSLSYSRTVTPAPDHTKNPPDQDTETSRSLIRRIDKLTTTVANCPTCDGTNKSTDARGQEMNCVVCSPAMT